ncbi:MAG: glycerophosphodiester phosphodiesterase [Pseudomonadota bacterium]|nr:glycerophosphodiester phosphodiesterase [Pseudomonadota bacterium]
MILIGHRGARKEAPENTLGGFRHLRQLGINHVELDVRLSKDRQLMVLHDTTVNRTTKDKGSVLDYTAAELEQMDATIPLPNWPETTGVPRLAAVLDEWPELKSIQLEVKTAAPEILLQIGHGLVDLIQQYHLHATAIITSSDQNLLAIMQRLAPAIKRGFVAERFTRDPIAVCLNHHCSHLVINHHRCSPELIAHAHALELEVSTWTVNEVNAARRLQHWGVDSIITDVPSTLLRHLHVAAE